MAPGFLRRRSDRVAGGGRSARRSAHPAGKAGRRMANLLVSSRRAEGRGDGGHVDCPPRDLARRVPAARHLLLRETGRLAHPHHADPRVDDPAGRASDRRARGARSDAHLPAPPLRADSVGVRQQREPGRPGDLPVAVRCSARQGTAARIHHPGHRRPGRRGDGLAVRCHPRLCATRRLARLTAPRRAPTPKRMRLPVLDRLILSAQRPSRYAGGELNAVRKDLANARVKWALAFPDTYEVGMSNVGFRLLYHVLNERPDVACERVFMPWPDMEAALKAEGQPLFSIESRAPLRAFDIVGFTLQFELCYTTVLAMLELGGIALQAKDRERDDPLILGGGPCTYNPEPVADFFDAFVIGEGEEVVHEISGAVAWWKGSGAPREDLLWLLAEIPGVYVPSLFRVHYSADGTIARYEPLKPGYESIVRRVIPDLNLVPQAEKPIVPFMQTVHDRLPLEIQRGCTRGCRFCQVGMLTRPTRQRDPNEVRNIADTDLEATGYEEVGFLSLSAGDYSCIDGVLEDFFDELGPENVGISLPSLRTETMNARLAGQIKRVRKSGITVAPEAATERMRRVINKGNAEKDLLHAVDTIFSAGWDLVKFYFMIGLPTERDEDVRAIVALCAEALRRGKKLNPRAEINVGVSTF